MDQSKRKHEMRRRRHVRIRKRLGGTAGRPRLCVCRSHKHIYAQVIDDQSGRTLLSASTLSSELRAQLKSGGNVQAASLVGDLIGRKCLESGITKLVFDRGGYRFHGRVKAVAEAARKRFQEAGQAGF